MLWRLTLVASQFAFAQPHSTMWADIRLSPFKRQVTITCTQLGSGPATSHLSKIVFAIPFVRLFSRFGGIVVNVSRTCEELSWNRTLMAKILLARNALLVSWHDNLAERSKAPASGAGPKGRGFKSHSCHISTCDVACFSFSDTILPHTRDYITLHLLYPDTQARLSCSVVSLDNRLSQGLLCNCHLICSLCDGWQCYTSPARKQISLLF